MLDVRMHPAVAYQAQQMQLPLASALHRAEQKLVLKKRAAAEGCIDPRDVHQDDAPGSNIQVPHFAVAHLPFRQPYGRPRSVDQRIGKLR